MTPASKGSGKEGWFQDCYNFSSSGREKPRNCIPLRRVAVYGVGVNGYFGKEFVKQANKLRVSIDECLLKK